MIMSYIIKNILETNDGSSNHLKLSFSTKIIEKK